SFQVNAPLGNVYLHVSTLNQTTNPLVVTSSALVANVATLRIEDGAYQPAGQTVTTAEASSFNMSGVAVSELDINAGTSTAVGLSISGPGDLNLGAVTSQQGDVSLTALGGSIFDATSGLAITVSANNVALAARDAIGASTDFLRIDSARRGPGLVTVDA